MRRITHIRRKILLLLMLTLLTTAVLALAAGEQQPRALIGSGGGLVAGSGLALRSAIGQPLAGSVDNPAGPGLCSGFLCAAALQMPPAPDDAHAFLPIVRRP